MKGTQFCTPRNGRLGARALLALIFVVAAAGVKPGIAFATPTISGHPAASVTAGTAYSFTPTASDPAGHTLSFAVANKPSWASFSSSTGTLSGTPTSAQVGRYPNVVIAVYAGGQSSVLSAFAITVVASSGGTPTVSISGSPATSITAGSAYIFRPTATDSAGKTLSYSVQNKPSWSSFSISTGQLSGTPSSTQTGNYSNIIITASDGTSSAALAPFSINVSAAGSAGTGSATLNWVDPSKNTNGTTLTNFAGIRIYYGTSSGSLTNMIQVADTSTTSYTISNLTSGTWYFAATAYNTAGVESAKSSIDSKAVL
ncbi:MAG: putative Ig domain-containing protein [Gammaproteobacteria bacterium]|nr:putative Ig domain-containing protein [Gammaproteobacteria bacterium]